MIQTNPRATMDQPDSRYRLGFLRCDHALGHLAERYGDYPEMFARAFAEVTDRIDWRVYDATAGELPNAVDECDGYLISGSRHGAYDALTWIAPLAEFIRRLADGGRPLVGLCFGHQIIAHALGAEVRKADQGWGIGIHAYHVDRPTAWMQPPRETFTVPVCHQDQVLSLPPGACRLASSAHCENFIVEYNPTTLGIQGHPEFERAFIAELVEWRHDSLPAQTYAAARKSLDRRHDNATVKTWILRFLGIPARDPE